MPHRRLLSPLRAPAFILRQAQDEELVVSLSNLMVSLSNHETSDS
ncbi:MAG TPA: hypothetical protein VIY09_00190 [Rhizomicrobium sp.]